MSKIYRTTDRIKVDIDGLSFSISPLNVQQKREIQEYLFRALNEKDMAAAQDASILAVKYAVKNVKGLTDCNDEEYAIKLDDNNTLSDENVDDLLNIQQNTKLAAVCTSLIHGVTSQILDPDTGKPMEGISFEDSEKKN